MKQHNAPEMHGKQIVFTKQANDFIFAQPIPVVSKLLQLVDELGKRGRMLPPQAKKVDDDLFELRLKESNNQYRVFYCYCVGNIIYILNGFIKKTQKTPLAEIRKAHAIIRQLEA